MLLCNYFLQDLVSIYIVQEVVFIHYKQPFAVAYLATSLLIVHLPIAFLKDWLLEFMRCQDDGETVDDSSAEPDSPVKHAAGHTSFEIEHQESLGNASSCIDMYSEDLDPLVSACTKNMDMVKKKKDKNFTTREIAKFGFCIAPLWFFTEVRPLHIVSVIFSWSFLHAYILFDLIPEKEQFSLYTIVAFL